MFKTFKPLFDRVLVKPFPVEEKTESGIILAQSDTAKVPTVGTVVAVGPGRTENAMAILPAVNVGDVVTWSKFAGVQIVVDGEPMLVMREADIWGVLS